MPAPALVLASTSPYRAQILSRLGIPFEQISPEVDETRLPGETPLELAQRLAISKAREVHTTRPDSIVIGGDQVAVCGGEALGKPGSLENAIKQLSQLSGNRVLFHSALAVIDPDAAQQTGIDTTEVEFRTLSNDEIERYLENEDALGCAGSFKSEGLGITLCEAIQSDDPTGLIGLPLILLSTMLRKAGFDLP